MAAKTMNLNLVQEMVTNYKSKQYLSIVTNTINPMPIDAQSVWFELNALKEFITAIEEEAARHPEFGLENFGVRFYYSAYPKNDLWGDSGYEDLADLLNNSSTSQYEKLHTLIAVPTAKMKGVDSDFNPYDTATYTGKKPVGAGLAIMAENHGSLVPPNGPMGAWF